MKVVIVGGVAGGATAAARIRRLDENAEIIIFEKSGFVSYANCGLPYYIGGVISDQEDLTLQTPEGFKERFNIDVRIRNEVTDVNKESKTVSVKNLDTGEVYEESYDKLILSPGAKPVRPNMPGIESKKIFTLRNVEDTLAIRSFAVDNKIKKAVLVGGGYIGIEIAENLCSMGVEVTIIQRPKQLMNVLDYDMAALVHAKLREKGIRLTLGGSVTGFEDTDSGISVLLKDADKVETDMVIMAIGVSPESALAKTADLKLGIKDSMIVNSTMRTSNDDIFALGDAVQIKNSVSDLETVIALAGPANKQARVAADNICGINSYYNGSAGSSVIKIFDMTAASTGLTEKAAKSAGIECDSVVLSPLSHASYYPGATTMTMKVVYEKNTARLLGAQIIGYDGVDKRIDVIATALHFRASAIELKNLDLAYAPPYSSAKDPVNMAGFMIENIFNGLVKQFHTDEIEAIQNADDAFLLDARTEPEYEHGHAEGFVNIPLDEIRQRIGEIPSDKKIYVMCQSGLRSYLACRILSQNGYDCYNFSGGYRFFKQVKDEETAGMTSFPCGMDR